MVKPAPASRGAPAAARLRATDSLARVGGDEFAILLPETDQAAARRVLGEIHHALRRFSTFHGPSPTISIGVVTFTSVESAEAMIAIADRAMYAIKQNGKNNVEYKLAG